MPKEHKEPGANSGAGSTTLHQKLPGSSSKGLGSETPPVLTHPRRPGKGAPEPAHDTWVLTGAGGHTSSLSPLGKCREMLLHSSRGLFFWGGSLPRQGRVKWQCLASGRLRSTKWSLFCATEDRLLNGSKGYTNPQPTKVPRFGFNRTPSTAHVSGLAWHAMVG